jgi:hypothetical protein
MAFIAKIMDKLAGRSSNAETIVQSIMRGERIRNIDAIKQAAAKWYPTVENSTYLAEVEARFNYFYGSMQADMSAVLKRIFPQGYDAMKQDQLNVRLIRYLVSKRASVFASKGEAYLTKDGEALADDHPSKLAFDAMIDESMFWRMAREIDRGCTLCQRLMAKPWWDTDDEKIQLGTWDPRGVYIMIDPLKYWRVDSAFAVGFSKPGTNGIDGEVLEVWTRSPDGKIAQHYETGVDGDRTFDEDGKGLNPYTWADGSPMYPFVWFREDALTAIYHLTDHDLLATNRALNARMTDMVYGERFRAHPPGFFTRTETSSGKAPDVIKVGPDDVNFLNPGHDFKYVPTLTDTAAQLELVKTISSLEAKIDGIDARALFGEQTGGAESGIALKIREKGLDQYLADKREVYAPQMIDLLTRMTIVNDYWRDDRQIGLESNGLEIGFKFGSTQDIDEESISRTYESLISLNVFTAIDLRSKLTGENMAAAEAAVRKNKDLNKEMKNAPPPAFDGQKSPALFGAAKKTAEEQAGKEGKPVDEEDDMGKDMPGPEA